MKLFELAYCCRCTGISPGTTATSASSTNGRVRPRSLLKLADPDWLVAQAMMR